MYPRLEVWDDGAVRFGFFMQKRLHPDHFDTLGLTRCIPIWSAVVLSLMASLFSFCFQSCFVFSPPSPCSPWVGLPLPLPLLLWERRVSVFRGRNREKRWVDRSIPPSLPPSLLCLFTGTRAVWTRVNEGHLVADWEPSAPPLLLSSSNSEALLWLCLLQLCVQLCRQTPSTVTCSKLIRPGPTRARKALIRLWLLDINGEAGGCSL